MSDLIDLVPTCAAPSTLPVCLVVDDSRVVRKVARRIL